MMNNVKILSYLGILEGLSYLALLGICMPLKYIYNLPEPTSVTGMLHGLLFLAYCGWALMVASDIKWSQSTTFWVLFASVLPFGTFVADRRIFRQYL